MASGEDVKYACCSLCLDDGRNTVARHYCVDCESYFCAGCVKCHKLPSLKSHQVNDVNISDTIDVEDEARSKQRGVQHEFSSEDPAISSSRLSCRSHPGKPIDTYCKGHNKVCCGTCVVVKHRSCTTVSITTAAKDFKSSPDMKKFQEALTENLVQCKQVKQKRDDNLDGIGKQKMELLENVDQYEEEVIAKVKELANISRTEIRSIHGQHKTVLETDIEALDAVTVANTECVDKLDQADDEELFIHAKTNVTVIEDGKMLLQALTKDWKPREILFRFNETLKKCVLGMKSLGQLEDKVDQERQEKYPESQVSQLDNDTKAQVAEYKATFQSKVQQRGEVFDMCYTSTKHLLLADCSKNKLKRFNSNLQFKDEIELPGQPVAVCEIDNHEVAVRIEGRRIVQFVSVGQTMQLTSSFTLDGGGFGMTYEAGTEEIFACEENKVGVYSKTGNNLRTYDTDTNGEKIFSACRQIALSENTQDVYVTDWNKGLIILDKSGTLKQKVSLSGVGYTWPVCVLPGGICLAGGWYYSGIFAQMDKDGKQVGKLIDCKDGRTYTHCAVYDHEHSRLIVEGGYPSMISVYTLSARYK